ncbi:MAG: lipoprotein-releasing system permease protein [Planctomycetota bacterium]|jgi:lipoprotein-releasing system permease protein
MYRLFLAIRYLLTRPINLLGMGGIAIAVWALVVVVSLFSGFLQVIEEHVQASSSDLVVTDMPPWAEWPALHHALKEDPNVAGMAPRLLHYGLLVEPGKRPPPAPLPGRGAMHGGDQPFLFVFGVVANLEAEATKFAEWIRHPDVPEELRVRDVAKPLAPINGVPTVLLGLDRMQREGLKPGDSLRLLTANLERDQDGNMTPIEVDVELVVGGAYQTNHGGFDGNNVFVDLSTLQKALFPNAPNHVQEIAVRVKDESQLDVTANRLGREVGRTLERDGHRFGKVQTWREKNYLFIKNVAHQRELLKIVLTVIMIVAAFLMLATLSMMVTEKTADIGILTAMGGTPTGVTMVFLSCGLVITGLGVLVGLTTGVITAVYLEEIRQAWLWATGHDLFPLSVYNLTRVPCRIEPLWLLQVTGMAMVTGLIVSALPALRAARHDPLISLRGA